MLDPAFLRGTAAAVRAARERISASLTSCDAALDYCCGGFAGGAVTAAIGAETRLAQAAALLDQAARLAAAAADEPDLIAEPIGVGWQELRPIDRDVSTGGRAR